MTLHRSSDYAALRETFVCSKYANSASQFLLYWMRIICCIYKDFVRQLKAVLPSFCHLCACEMSPGWGHLITWMDPSVGHLNSILAPVVGISKKSNARGVARWGRGWSFDLADTLVTLSNGVFERRTSTGSGLFASLGSGLVIREKKLSNTNLSAPRQIKREKASLPVDERRSKTGSLSNSVFERRTSTGSGLFASLGSGSVATLG